MKFKLKDLKVSQLELWLAWKMLFSRRALFGGSAPLALGGLILGVACLFVSMAVMSGFESTLRQAMADVTGHVRVVKTTRTPDPWLELEEKIRVAEPSLVSTTRFTSIEAIFASQGVISGVLIQGVDQDRYQQVLNLNSRLIEGKIQLAPAQGNSKALALIGRGLAEKLKLKPGDSFRVVVPISNAINPGVFKRRIGEFQISGILDLGKYDWNERFIMTDLKSTQDLAEIGDKYMGLILRFADIEESRKAGFRLNYTLGRDYWIRDWRDSNENLFDAIKIERPTIFFVVFIIVMVAAFNVSSTLYVNVVQRYGDISLLKSLGVRSLDILKIFSLQGLLIGAVGIIFGSLLGLLLCWFFVWGQANLGLIQGSVYKIDGINVEIRFIDFMGICFSTLLICFVATLAPALRGARLSPVEGLKYG
ncbi:MAG: ABC transporter permease [Bdellovibrionota bacterium]